MNPAAFDDGRSPVNGKTPVRFIRSVKHIREACIGLV